MNSTKHTKFFNHQLLDASDMQSEQDYHRGMRYMNNRNLYTCGIVYGFTAKKKTGEPKKVILGRGMAVDRDGREIVLGREKEIDFGLPGFQVSRSYYIVLSWNREPGLPRQGDQLTRWEEEPCIDVTADFPPEPASVPNPLDLPSEPGSTPIDSGYFLAAAKVVLDSKGDVGSIDSAGQGFRRPPGGLKIPDGYIGTDHLATHAVTEIKIDNHAVTHYKIKNDNVIEAKLAPNVRSRLVTNGNSHNHHGGDGGQISHSSLKLDGGTNPHGTTARDVGALSLNGGNINGNTTLCGDFSITSRLLPPDNSTMYLYSIGSPSAFSALRIRVGNFWTQDNKDRSYYFRVEDVSARELFSINGHGYTYIMRGSFSGSDYAEYFESNLKKKIEPGISVVLANGKVRPAKKGEIPLGIISANPAMAGGVYCHWPKKYLKDEFGSEIMEKNKDGIMVPKLNPEYDETQEYIPRQNRPEWNCVGLLGQLPLRKNQPTAPTWIKIKDINKDIELWLIK